MNKYLIGIDTGGTFTDGVLLNYSTREVVSASKSLTTHKDLKQGVIKALKKLEIPDDHQIKLVGISSTLATNSIAEGKARKVALLLIGYQQSVVENFGLEENFATKDLTYVKGGHNARGVEMNSLDLESIRNWIHQKKKEVDAVAISSYFSPLNPSHEKRAFEIISQECDLPVVLGHQLSTKLNSVKRAATASINASLVAVMQDFLQSVSNSLKELHIKAPLMIVRGDGTLMPYNEALQKPVETVLSGPAASAIGGRFLSNETRSLVIDMGSTTTDMALVRNSRVVVSESGAKVGETETAVEAARIRTISIGCDSRISLEGEHIQVGPDRVRSLAQISSHYSHIAQRLFDLSKNDFQNLKSIHDLEFWHLYQHLDPHTESLLDEQQKAILKQIEEPCQLSQLMEKFNILHPEHLNLHNLIHQGFVECSTLNPTDLLHANNTMDLWNNDVAKVATEAYCKLYNISKSEFFEKIFDHIEDQLVEETLLYLASAELNDNQMPDHISDQWGQWFLNEILYDKSDLLTLKISGKLPIIGSGAPARHFLKSVSKLINTKLHLPKHSEVANAVGAVSGSLSETREAIVFIYENDNQFTYQVKYGEEYQNHETYQEACEAAEDISYQLAREATVQAGGTDPFTEVTRKKEGSLTRFIAKSIANPKLSKTWKENTK